MVMLMPSLLVHQSSLISGDRLDEPFNPRSSFVAAGGLVVSTQDSVDDLEAVAVSSQE